MKKVISILLLVGVGIVLMPDTGNAIPAFARKYGFNCNMCHTSFVKLNDFGQRFRDNGYQIPGQAGNEKNVFESMPPISIRTSAGLNLYNMIQKTSGSTYEVKGTTSGFSIYGFDLLAAGVMHKNVSFLMIYTPRLDEPAGDFTGPNGGNNPSQTGALESANLVFSNLVPDAVNLRIGRFEPSYHPISAKRSYYIQQPYEVYGFTTPSNGFNFEDNQLGVEVSGAFRSRTHYSVGVVNGNGGNPDNNVQKDMFLTVHQIFGRGEGQSAGQRVGVFGYLGRQSTAAGDLVAPSGETNGKESKGFYRIGLDASLNWRNCNLRGLLMHGVDNKDVANSAFSDFAPWLSEDYKYTGGFVEVDYAALPNNRLMLSSMFNWVQPPDIDKERKVNAISVLGRYYLGDWTAVNVALHAEYTHKETGDHHKLKEDMVLLLVDFDF